jgi:hypothetical protein
VNYAWLAVLHHNNACSAEVWTLYRRAIRTYFSVTILTEQEQCLWGFMISILHSCYFAGYNWISAFFLLSINLLLQINMVYFHIWLVACKNYAYAFCRKAWSSFGWILGCCSWQEANQINMSPLTYMSTSLIPADGEVLHTPACHWKASDLLR